jgi:hypothetical protein
MVGQNSMYKATKELFVPKKNCSDISFFSASFAFFLLQELKKIVVCWNNIKFYL